MIKHPKSANDLIERVLAGNRRAQARLYERFAPYSLAIIGRYGIPQKAEADVLQEIFLEVFTKLDRYNARKGKFTTWLRQITVFRCLDYQRRHQRLIFRPVPETDFADYATEASISQANTEELLDLIKSLPTGYRTIFNLYAVEGYRHQEIALLLGISEQTSRSQYHRARQKLREALKKTVTATYHE
ncbi:MAG: sigma-70 family RNA polymerase sigma factor [Bacteroidota bacterium]